jgi:hypothetical protein
VRYKYANVKFKAPQKQQAPYTDFLVLNSSEFYQDQLFYNPEDMTIETPESCYYTTYQIASYNDINESSVICAYNKPCESEKTTCVKTASFMCECLDWKGLTCGGYRAYMGMDVEHTGFLRANGTLFYKKEYFSPIANTKTVQGPLEVTPIFLPNPWIEIIHNKSFQNITLALEIKNNGGGEIEITKASAYPANLQVITSVKGFSESLKNYVEIIVNESLGLDILNCKDITGKIESGLKIYKQFCTLSRPHLKVEIVNVTVGNETISSNVEVNDVKDYCSNGLSSLNVSEELKGYFKDIEKAVGATGLCEILQEKNVSEEKITGLKEEWKNKIENSLKAINVIIELDYDRKFTYRSGSINIYTNTPECLTLSCCNGETNPICPEGWSIGSEEWNRNCK